MLSADITAPDHERPCRFYARVLTTGAVPLWREADLLNSRGMPIIGTGRITWLDIMVPDADTLRDFYANVVGWCVEPLPMQHDGEP